MNRPIYMVLAGVLTVGCNKPSGPATDRTMVTKAEPVKLSFRKQEPPQLAPLHRFTTGIREVSRVLITDDGSRAAVGSDGIGNREQIEIWDLSPQPKKVREVTGLLRALSQDGKLLARPGKEHGTTEVIDTSTGVVVSVVPEVGDFIQFAGPDRLMIVRSESGAVRVGIYDERSGKRESGFEIPSPDRANVLGLVNGRQELVVGWGSTSRVEVWNLGTGRMTHGVTLPDSRPKGSWDNFAASPDGKRVTARRRTDQPVGVYDTGTAAEVTTVGLMDSVAFVPGRDLILGRASWIGDGFKAYSGLRALDLTKKAIVMDLPGAYLSPATSSDGRVMVTMVDRAEPDLLVWDLTRIP